LNALQGGELGPKEVADVAGLPHASVKHTLRKMVEAGQVEKTTRGKYQLPEVNDPHSPRSPHSPSGAEPAENCAAAKVNGAAGGVHLSGEAFTVPPWRRKR
jgi:exoribonuclease R